MTAHATPSVDGALGRAFLLQDLSSSANLHPTDLWTESPAHPGILWAGRKRTDLCHLAIYSYFIMEYICMDLLYIYIYIYTRVVAEFEQTFSCTLLSVTI